MKYVFLVLSALMGLCPAALAQTQEKPFAVVELFSSEGCSSCPAADLLISKLTVWARKNNEPVYPLVFHVDYWNNFGWRDVFSNSAFTQRQKDYARVFKDQGIYTPEMIVNGIDAFVGSDQQQLQKDLDQQLVSPATVVLHAALARTNRQVQVNFTCKGYSEGDVVHIALVERGLSTDVTAGENSGRRLHHDNVVREFESRPLQQGSGQVNLALDKVADPAQASVIVFVQNPQTMLIEAARQLDVEMTNHD